MTTTPCLTDETMVALVERTADAERRRAACAHLDGCDACRGLLAEWARHFVPDDEPDATSLVAGAEVEQYVITRELGRGARGIVYLARDGALGREVVLKFAVRSDDARERAALVAEGKTLAALAHPNVVRIFDLSVWRGHVYLAMEAVDGIDLRSWLTRETPSVEATRRVLRDVAAGLNALHRAGIVHRDVKPENVIVGSDGVARVIDLDLAHRRASERLTCRLDASRAAGTPRYMAPEALAGAVPSASADVYGFCVTALEALGHPSARSMTTDRAALRLLQRGLDAEPTRRPAMAELETALAAPRWRSLVRRATLALSAAAMVTTAVVVAAGAHTSMLAPPPRPSFEAAAGSGRAASPLGASTVNGTEVASETVTLTATLPITPGGAAAHAAPVINGAPPLLPSKAGPGAGGAPLDPFAGSAVAAAGRAFDSAAAQRAVAAVDVGQCSSAFGTSTLVTVVVRFRPRGDVDHLTLVRGTSSRRCLERLFKAVRVAPYVAGNGGGGAIRSFRVVEAGDG